MAKTKTEETKEKGVNPFDFSTSISWSKEDLIREKGYSEDDYNPFLMNRNFALFNDTIFDANEMNMLNGLGKKLQYDYLRLSLKKRKRFQKWTKYSQDPNVLIICEKYEVGKREAKDILNLLSKEQIEKIIEEEKIRKGG